ncbi:MAG TPA: CoA pyrophosphatase [Acidimicrobiales bacterium]|nr:CoA pyrophosphatase [Acidimicrobiales bacterium]
MRLALAQRRPGGAAGSPREVAPPELPGLPGGAETRPAGVVCLLFERHGEANVLLTLRSDRLRTHAGEVSFPGGRLRPGELPLHAALREAHEEVGLDGGCVQVAGELSPLTTRLSPALVYCFVATFPGPDRAGSGGCPLRADSREVARIFWVPLARLAEEGVFHEELWPAVPGLGAATAVPFFQLGEDLVWGATGRLLYELLSAVLARRATPRPPRGTLVR